MTIGETGDEATNIYQGHNLYIPVRQATHARRSDDPVPYRCNAFLLCADLSPSFPSL